MRIDYSEPRQSYTTTGALRQRPGSGRSGAKVVALIAVSGLLFGSGFGIGWYFSQQSAKKAFRAAMEQQSLETAPKGASVTQPTAVRTTSPQAATPPQAATVPPPHQPPADPVAAQQPVAPGTAPSGQPLSFFENLPKGQKNTVLGSGINEKPKPAAPQPAPVSPAQPGSPSVPLAKKPDTKKGDQPGTAAKPVPQPSGYLVQVASYSNRKDADSLKAKLVAKGYAAVVTETVIGDKTWYRVRIGRHLDKESATQISNQLMMGAKVVPDLDER